MKNAIILHGTGDTPESFWIPWLKKELEKAGYKVWSPQLPDRDNPSLNKWLPFLLENGDRQKKLHVEDERRILPDVFSLCSLILYQLPCRLLRLYSHRFRQI